MDNMNNVFKVVLHGPVKAYEVLKWSLWKTSKEKNQLIQLPVGLTFLYRVLFKFRHDLWAEGGWKSLRQRNICCYNC